jgi:hypothetical protein
MWEIPLPVQTQRMDQRHMECSESETLIMILQDWVPDEQRPWKPLQ